MPLSNPFAIKAAGVAESSTPTVLIGTTDDVLFDAFYADVEGSGSALPTALGVTWSAGTRAFTFDGPGTWLLHLSADVNIHATADLMCYFLWGGAATVYVGSARGRYPKAGLATANWGTVTPGFDFSTSLTLLQDATLKVECGSDTAAWSPLSYVTLEIVRLV